jgi:hypothetical protein
MGNFIRGLDILLELILLTALLYSFLKAFKLTLFDLGLHPKYKRFVRISLFIIGGMVLSFLIAHLITFYPNRLLWITKG